MKKPDIILGVFALAAVIYFQFNGDTRLSNHLRQSFTATQSAIVETDAHGHIIGASSELAAMTGYTHREILKLNIAALMDDAAKARAKHDVGFGVSPQVTVIRCAIVSRSGRRVPVMVMARVADGIYIATITPLDLVVGLP